MKAAVTALLVLLLSFPASATEHAPERGLFVSVIQEPPVLSSRAQITELIDFARKSGVKTLFVQVYRANKSWFDSRTGDSTPYRQCRASVGEDPLALLIREAHAAGLDVHAWLNLLSLSANTEAPLLKRYGPGILTRNTAPKKTIEDYKIDNQYFLEPGDPRVRGALGRIVREVLTAYPELDGIQFDYIRYPDVHPAYGHSPVVEKRFLRATGFPYIEEGSAVWKEWQRLQVTSLLKRLVRLSRALRPGIQVSTTGLTPYTRALLEANQDWKTWANEGMVDFVTLMCYSTDFAQFERYLADARLNVHDPDRLNIAIGSYKFLDSPDGFQKQFDLCENGGYKSCVTLHYGDIVQNPALGNAFQPMRKRLKI